MSNKCTPCEIAVAGGILIREYCKKDCKSVIGKFQEGELTIQDLQRELEVPQETIDVLKGEGLSVDMTLKKAVELHNRNK